MMSGQMFQKIDIQLICLADIFRGWKRTLDVTGVFTELRRNSCFRPSFVRVENLRVVQRERTGGVFC